MTRNGIVTHLYSTHVEARPFSMFTEDDIEQEANRQWRSRAEEWGFFHVGAAGNWDGSKSRVVHSADCIGLHTSCEACGDDILRICCNEFGAPDACEVHL